MRAIAILVLGAAACEGGYSILPEISGRECYGLECSLMAGGDVRAYAIAETDTGGEIERARHVTVDPPEAATVELDGDVLVIHAGPTAFDSAWFRVELEGGVVFDTEFSVATRATTAVVPDPDLVPIELFPQRKLPGERLAVFDTQTLLVLAENRDDSGALLLGHDDSEWASENVELTELLPEVGRDMSLVRLIRTMATGTATVSHGTATLPIDSVPVGTTARLEVAEHALPTTSIALYPNEYTSLTVLAYAEDGRFIFGASPFLPVRVESSDPAIVQITREASTDRRIGLEGYRSGTATLSVTFDGRSTEIPVTVY